MKPLAFLDIETTGLDPFENEILEVAYIRETEDGGETTEFSLEIEERRANEEALKINKYHLRRNDLAAIELPWNVAADKLSTELDGYVIVGNNPTFDLTFLRFFLRRWHKPIPWHYRPLDIGSMACGLLGEREVKTPAVAEAFNVPLPRDQHTALADAKWNQDVYRAMMEVWPPRCDSS